MKFGPPFPFGSSTGPGRTAAKNQPATVLFDANTGRATIESRPGLAVVRLGFERFGLQVAVDGDVTTVRAHCESLADLQSLIAQAYYLLPALLVVELIDPPVVLNISGSIGEARFTWEFAEMWGEFDVTESERQERRIVEAWERLGLFQGLVNRRLAAALHYFHVAARLLSAGQSPWEFMAEAILNFYKILHILFGDSRDSIRAGLAQLGIDAREVEAVFIPVTLLRDSFDVGHPMISLLTLQELDGLYRLAHGLEDRFRNLLRRALRAVTDGTFHVQQESDLVLDSDKRAMIQRIINAYAAFTANQPAQASNPPPAGREA